MRRIDLTSEEAADVAWAWWLFLLVGAASLIAGCILVAQPSHSLATLAVVVGIFMLLDGIVELFRSFGHSVANRGLAAIIGVLGIVVGIALIRHPFHGVTAIGLLIGIWLIAVGVVRLVQAIALGTQTWFGVALSLLDIVAGIVIVANPHIGYTALAVIAGIWLIVSGIGTIALGIAIRGAAKSSPAPV